MGVAVSTPGRNGRVVAPANLTFVDSPDPDGVARTPGSVGSVPDRTAGVLIPTGFPGAPGEDGEDGVDAPTRIFEFQMPMASSTVVIDHDLGRDPVSVQVFVDGYVCEGYGVFFTIPSKQVQISFDISAVATIRLL